MTVCLVNRGTVSQHGSALGNLCSNAVLTLDSTMLSWPISLFSGSIHGSTHGSTASNTCAQSRTGIHRHHKHTQKRCGPLTADLEMLSYHKLLKKYVPVKK